MTHHWKKISDLSDPKSGVKKWCLKWHQKWDHLTPNLESVWSSFWNQHDLLFGNHWIDIHEWLGIKKEICENSIFLRWPSLSTYRCEVLVKQTFSPLSLPKCAEAVLKDLF